MTLKEHLAQMQKIQGQLPSVLKSMAKGATIQAIREAAANTPPIEKSGDDLSGTNTRAGTMKQHWATDSKTTPVVEGQTFSTELNNNMKYASYVNDGHRMDRHFVPGLYVNPFSGKLEYDPSKKKKVGIMVGTKTFYVKGLHITDKARKAYSKALKIEADRQVGRLFK